MTTRSDMPLVDELYDKIVVHDDLAGLLRSMSAHFGARSGLVIRTENGVPQGHDDLEIDRDLLAVYNDHFSHIDPWHLALRERGFERQPQLVIGHEMVDLKEPRHRSFKAEIVDAQGFANLVAFRSVIGTALTTDISLHFDEAGLERFSGYRKDAFSLFPMVDFALRYRESNLAHLTGDKVAAETMESLNEAVLRITDGHVIYMNAAARALDRKLGLVCKRGGRSVLAHPAFEVPLMSVASGARRLASFVVALGERPFRCSLNRAGSTEEADGDVIMALNPVAERLDVDAMARMYALTTREKQILLKFWRHGPRGALAEACGVTPNTLKWHIKNIRIKCGCATQTDLMALLRHWAA